MTAELIAQALATVADGHGSVVELHPLPDGGSRIEVKPEPLLTVSDVAEILRMEPEAVRRLVRSNRLHSLRPAGRNGQILFDRCELYRDLKKHTRRKVR